ncbi:MAG: ABC transporter permease [Bacteroidota bacterium]
METQLIRYIARQELVVNIRNKWTIIFAAVFGLLIAAISYGGIMAEGFSGMQTFTRTSVSILNLVLYIVPLISLVMGTISFTGDKGSMELLYSQPVSRAEVMIGKILGLFFSITLSMISGFFVAGALIATVNDAEGLIQYSMFVLLSLMLALVFLCIAVVVATMYRRKSKAFGVALFLWFFYVLFYDLIAVAGSVMFSGQSANRFLFLSLFGNPVDMVRVAGLIILDNVTIFGAAGAALLRFLGGSSVSIIVLTAAMILWVGIPVYISNRMLKKQDI